MKTALWGARAVPDTRQHREPQPRTRSARGPVAPEKLPSDGGARTDRGEGGRALCGLRPPLGRPERTRRRQAAGRTRTLAPDGGRISEGRLRQAGHPGDAAQCCVDSREGGVPGAGSTAASDAWLVQDAAAAHGGKASQGVGDQRGRSGQRPLGEDLDRLLGQWPLRQAQQVGGDRCHSGDGAARAGDSAMRLPQSGAQPGSAGTDHPVWDHWLGRAA